MGLCPRAGASVSSYRPTLTVNCLRPSNWSGLWSRWNTAASHAAAYSTRPDTIFGFGHAYLMIELKAG